MNDLRVVAVFVAYIVAVVLLGIWVARVVADQFDGPWVRLATALLVLAIAIGGWALFGIPWARRTLLERRQRLCPDVQTHASFQDDGIAITEDLGSVFWRWGRVHRAVAIAEGVLVLAGNGGMLIPLPDKTAQQSLVEFVNARAVSPIAAKGRTN